jgi:non-specific serine/threonine protein kinase
MTEHRQLAAIMFTDIVGYSALMGKDERSAMEVLEKNRSIHKLAIEKHNGTYIKEIGDGTLSIFQSSLAAILCALEIQKACCKEKTLEIRVGIHIGDVIFSDNDVFGDGVNIAARIESSGEPGGIYFSEKVYDDIRNKTDIQAEFVGEKSLKNIDYPIRIYSISKEREALVYREPKRPKHKEKEKSIIVLPFVNMSPEPGQEYFSDGLTEEIITDLSHIRELLVISRSSAMTFKGTRKTIPEIASAVKVRYVLEGSVRKIGSSLRITAQLIDANHDTHLWAEKFSGSLDDVFDIQEKVSRSIAHALKIKLTNIEKHSIEDHPVKDIRSYDCYLKARQEYLHFTEDSLERAISLANDGLRLIGDNILLYSILGQVHWAFVNLGIRLEDHYLEKAEEYANKIFSMDPESPNGFYLMGLIDYKRGNTQSSVRNTKIALFELPNNADAIDHLLWMYADAGRTEHSEPLIRRMLEIDPFTPHNHWVTGWTRLMQGKTEESSPHFLKAYQMDPANPIWRLLYAHFLFMTNRNSEGNEIVAKMVKDSPNHMLTSLIHFIAFAAMGDKGRSLSYITEDIIRFGEWDELISWMLSQGYSLNGEITEALKWFKNATERGLINYPFLNDLDPFLDNIRGEPVFKKLMQKVKFKWKNFEV